MKKAVFTVNPITGVEYYHGILEVDEMTVSEFVRSLWENDPNGSHAELIDLKTAEIDLGDFAADGMELPEGITPESYMEAWNELVRAETMA